MHETRTAPAAPNGISSHPAEQQVSAAPFMALISLPRTRPAVVGARHWLADTLTAWSISGDQLDNVVLALSEVFTNSVEHAAGDGHATVTAALWQGHLRITVSDPDPELHDAASDDEHGRGLLVVEALTMRHGATRIAGGKIIWFEQMLTPPMMTGGCLTCGCSPSACGSASGCGCTCCCSYLPAVTASCSCGCPVAVAGECMCGSLCPCDPCAYCDRDASNSSAGGAR